jgi:hypothetical protein
VKVLCTGDRDWTDFDTILRAFATLSAGTEIVHGGARGADDLCSAAARQFNFRVHVHPADWDKYGRAAGPLRNSDMLRLHPDISEVFCFHADLANSRGTADMVRKAVRAGLPVRYFRGGE